MFLSHTQSPTRKPDPSDVCEEAQVSSSPSCISVKNTFLADVQVRRSVLGSSHTQHCRIQISGPFKHLSMPMPRVGRPGPAGLSAGRDRHPLQVDPGPGSEVSMQGPRFIWEKREILCILIFMQYSDFNSLQPSQGSSSPQHERSRQTPSVQLPHSVSQCLPP